MSELIYVDTNVWLDYFLNRKDMLRPLGDFAFELFRKSASCSYRIVVSDWLTKEMHSTGNYDSFMTIENELARAGKIVHVNANRNDIVIARRTIHWHDALHELLAIKAGATYLVTRNVSDFSGLQIRVVYPENL